MTTDPYPSASTMMLTPRAAGRQRAGGGADRLTVVLVAVACFLGILALLASQLRAAPASPRPVLVLRKIYRTTVITTLAGGTGHDGTTVSQSSSASGALPVAAPTTRTS